MQENETENENPNPNQDNWIEHVGRLLQESNTDGAIAFIEDLIARRDSTTGHAQLEAQINYLANIFGLRGQTYEASKEMAWRVFDIASRGNTPSTSVANARSLMRSMSCLGGLIEDEPTEESVPKWKRVLLKLSGQALSGNSTEIIDSKLAMSIAREVAVVKKRGVQVAILVGGGNIFRGASWAASSGLNRPSADYMGMLGTVVNAIFLQATLESLGVPTRIQSVIPVSEVAEPYNRRRALRHLEKGRVVIFAAGTGNPFFTSDTAAALRCAGISAEVVLKACNIDGLYDSDQTENPDARVLETVSYREVASKVPSVIDITAISICEENHIPGCEGSSKSGGQNKDDSNGGHGHKRKWSGGGSLVWTRDDAETNAKM